MAYLMRFDYEWSDDHTILLCYGVNHQGFSIAVRIRYVTPYLYFKVPRYWVEKRLVRKYTEELCDALNEKLVEDIGNDVIRGVWKLKAYTRVLTPRHKIQRHINIKEYHSDEGSLFVRLNALTPKLIPIMRKMLQNPFGAGKWLGDEWKLRGLCDKKTLQKIAAGTIVPNCETLKGKGLKVFEGHIPFDNRCFVDNNLNPCSWWVLPETKYEMVYAKSERVTLCDLEYTVSMTDIRPAEGWDKKIPLTLDAYFDCEMYTHIRFPSPMHDPIIQISVHMYLGKTDYETYPNPKNKEMPLTQFLDEGNYVRILLALKSVRPMDHYTPICYETEKDLIIGFFEVIKTLGPDTLNGHNINNFDFRYILKRCEILGIDIFKFLGKHRWKSLFWKEDQNVKGMARATTSIPGIVVWDFMHYSTNFLFLQDNSLDGIAKKLLKGVHKKEMNYEKIAEYQQTEEGRTLLADYCDYDTRILRLFDEKANANLLLRTLAKDCFIDMQNVLDRASEYKIMGLFLWFTRNYRNDGKFLLIPTKDPASKKIDDGGYEGGAVIEAVKGYYPGIPIYTLDYKSLYPSIIRARNLCFSTYLPSKKQKKIMKKYNVDAKDVWDSPQYVINEERTTTIERIVPNKNPSYVKNNVRRGLLPLMEDSLYKKRNAIKSEMKAIEKKFDALVKKSKNDPLDDDEKEEMNDLAVSLLVFDAAQLVKKIIMNAAYGIIAAITSNMRAKEIASTITREARQYLEIIRYRVERMVIPGTEMDWQCRVHVVYGDTDSIMCMVMPEPHIKFSTEREMVRWVWAHAVRVTKCLNDMLAPETDGYLILELEKLSVSTLFMLKKKYVMYCYMGPEKEPEILVKGLSEKRRDGCKLKRDTCKELIETALVQRDLPKAIDVARAAVARVRRREIPESDLVMVKTLRRELEQYANQISEQVVMTKNLRSQGFDVRVGDQIKYIVSSSTQKSSVSDRVVAPDEVLNGSKQYDCQYYVDVVMKEARRMLSLALDNTPYEIHRARQQRILKHPELSKSTLKKEENKENEERKKNVDLVVLHGQSIDSVMKSRQCTISEMFKNQAKKKKIPAQSCTEQKPEKSSSKGKEEALGQTAGEKRKREASSANDKSKKRKIYNTKSSSGIGQFFVSKKRTRDDDSGTETGESSPKKGKYDTTSIDEIRITSYEKKKNADRKPINMKRFQRPAMVKKSPLFTHFKVLESCIKCKCPVESTERNMCKSHEKFRLIYYYAYCQTLWKLMDNNKEIWIKCPKCERGNAVREHCDSMKCPNWAARRKIQQNFYRLALGAFKSFPTREDMIRESRRRRLKTPQMTESELPPLITDHQ